MAEDYKKIAESIRSGKYFEESRGWFQAMYIGPISERTFFLIIAVMAGLIFLFAFISIIRLMPITVRTPILVHAGERADEEQMSLVALAPNHAPVNPGITQFFLTRYVQLRESFDARTFLAEAKFIRAQSDAATYNAYVGAYNPTNPQSPFAAMGEQGQRLVEVDSVTPVQVKGAAADHGSAIVSFSTTSRGVSNPETTQWTANIDYIYTGITPTMGVNAETKEPELEVAEPHFQVVNYVLSQQAAQ